MGKVINFTGRKGCSKDKDTIQLLCRVLRVSEKYFNAIIALPTVPTTEVGKDMIDLVYVIDEVIKQALEDIQP